MEFRRKLKMARLGMAQMRGDVSFKLFDKAIGSGDGKCEGIFIALPNGKRCKPMDNRFLNFCRTATRKEALALYDNSIADLDARIAREFPNG